MLRWKFLIVIPLWLSLVSCTPIVFLAGTVTGIGGYKYYHGVMTIIYESPFKETWEATIKSLEEMGFEIKKKRHDLTTGKVVAIGSDKKRVSISLKYRSSQETEVAIRVGYFGDKDFSEHIKEKIRKKLFE